MFESLLSNVKRLLGMLRMKSPYVEQPNRLADVIAAIQVMGTYKYYKLDVAKWGKRIRDVGESGDEAGSVNQDESASKQVQINESKWTVVFDEHPEFFRLGNRKNKASLVWRRSYPKLFDTKKLEEITPAKYKGLTAGQKGKVSRKPLTTEQIDLLIRTAIDLHARAIAHRQERRWWITALVGGGAIATMFGFLE